MSFFSHKIVFLIRTQDVTFWEYQVRQKNIILIRHSYVGLKRITLMRGFRMRSQNWAWIMFDPCFNRRYPRSSWTRDYGIFWRFFGQHMGQIICKFNSETIFRIPSSRRSFSSPNMNVGLKLCCWHHLVFLKLYILCANQKGSFLWEQNDIVLLLTSHGKGLAPKTWKKVEFGAKWYALMICTQAPGQIRSGQVRSCKVIWIWK